MFAKKKKLKIFCWYWTRTAYDRILNGALIFAIFTDIFFSFFVIFFPPISSAVKSQWETAERLSRGQVARRRIPPTYLAFVGAQCEIKNTWTGGPPIDHHPEPCAEFDRPTLQQKNNHFLVYQKNLNLQTSAIQSHYYTVNIL